MALLRRKPTHCRIHQFRRAVTNQLCDYCLDAAPKLALKLWDLPPSAQIMTLAANDIAALRLIIASSQRSERA